MSLYTFLYKGQVYDTVTVDNAASAVHSSLIAPTFERVQYLGLKSKWRLLKILLLVFPIIVLLQ